MTPSIYFSLTNQYLLGGASSPLFLVSKCELLLCHVPIKLYLLGFRCELLNPVTKRFASKPITNSVTSPYAIHVTPRRSSGLMSGLSQLRLQPTGQQQLAAHQRTLQRTQKCHAYSIFTKSKFLQGESLLLLP